MIDFRNIVVSIISAGIVATIGMLIFIIDHNSAGYFSALISSTLGNVQFVSAGLALMMIDMYPIFIFEIIFGTLIYKRFCECSAYYFIRQKKRWLWFARESAGLLLLSLLYWFIYFTVYFVGTGLRSGVAPGGKVLLVAGTVLVIYSLFVFACTLLINGCSILSGSQRGFIAIFCLQLFFTAFLAFQEKLSTMNVKLLRFDPISGLITSWHSIPMLHHKSYLDGIKFPLSDSVIGVIVFMIVAILVSYKIVASSDISLYNKELDA